MSVMSGFCFINAELFNVYSAGVVYIGTESTFPATRLQQMIENFKDKYSQGPASYTDNIFVHHIPDMVVIGCAGLLVNLLPQTSGKNMRGHEQNIKILFSIVYSIAHLSSFCLMSLFSFIVLDGEWVSPILDGHIYSLLLGVHSSYVFLHTPSPGCLWWSSWFPPFTHEFSVWYSITSF